MNGKIEKFVFLVAALVQRSKNLALMWQQYICSVICLQRDLNKTGLYHSMAHPPPQLYLIG